MNKDDILDKIKKCLALAASDNPHEAAAALRQAQKMMAAHDLTEADVASSEVGEKSVNADARSRPSYWCTFLVHIVADAFHCKVVFSTLVGVWTFIGVGPDPIVAEYTFAVLLRQVKKSRADYIRTTLKRCTKTKTKRADAFCLGYVRRLAVMVDAFANPNPNEAAITAYCARKHPNIKENLRRAPKAVRGDLHDMWAGSIEGKNAQLFRAARDARQTARLPGDG
ncbi:MAG: DUF2786 domain-containing protein [Azoarcus sp.]|jgi:hypothetical protein|nr:DUF2786 domain-containing protein [Azoarcus sp.]